MHDVQCALYGRILPVLGDKLINEITSNDLDTFLSSTMNECAASTKKKYRKFFRWIFKEARKSNITTVDPIADMEPIRDGKKRGKAFLSSSQLADLLSFLWQSEHPLRVHASVAAFSSIRINEQRGLQFQDILWDSDLLHIRRVRSRKGIIKDCPKNGEPRYVALNPQLKRILEREKELRNPLPQDWVLPPNRKFETGEQGDILKGVLQLLNLPVITWYEFRHSCAMAMDENGASLAIISTQLGHSSIDVTSRYMRDLGARIRGATDKIKFLPDEMIDQISKVPSNENNDG